MRRAGLIEAKAKAESGVDGAARRGRGGVCDPDGARPRGVRGVRGWGPSSDVDALARVSRRLELADTARDSASDISRDAA
jgi:hypothetical protein